jgi:hypothetical protein
MNQTDEVIRIQLATILRVFRKFGEREITEKYKKCNQFMRVFSQYLYLPLLKSILNKLIKSSANFKYKIDC